MSNPERLWSSCGVNWRFLWWDSSCAGAGVAPRHSPAALSRGVPIVRHCMQQGRDPITIRRIDERCGPLDSERFSEVLIAVPVLGVKPLSGVTPLQGVAEACSRDGLLCGLEGV